MSGEEDERTPLLRNQPVNHHHSKKSYHIYGSSLGILFLFAIFINWYRTLLPTPLSDAQARQTDDFAGIHAYNEYLSRFIAPHSANTRENGVMRDWFVSIVTDFQQEATDRGLQMDVIGYDPSIDVIPQDWFTPNEQWYVESRNIIIRLNGTSGKEDAVLVNAHYDSVPTSNGVTDDGMGVVTVLELIRYFVEHPPRHTIIFLINNFEEGGLLGAKSFIHHPWYKQVKVFYNLEGSGAGGRALIFRCTNMNAVKRFANSKAQLKHGSALGNDIFKRKLIKSDTDYSVFVGHGVQGVDIAFYTPRSFYHTSRDDLAHTTPEALQYMGQIALHAVREIANDDSLLTTTDEEESFVFYDILGRWMFVYSILTYQITNILALVAVPVIAFSLAIRRQPSALAIIQQRVLLTVQGFVAVIIALVFTILFIGVAAVVIIKINPSMSYGDVYGAALYTFVAGFLGLQVSQLILPRKLKTVLAQTDAAWYGLLAFWWLFVALSTYTSTLGIAGLYFAIYLLVSSSLGLLVHTTISSQQKLRSAIIYFTQITVPAVFLIENEFLSMDSLRHATADGTPEIAVYIFLAFPLVLLLLHFVPWIHVAGNQRKITIGATIAFVFLFTICSALQPFNGSWSPNKLVFRQDYNYGDAFATVIVSTATGLQSILKKTLPSHEYNTLQCEPFKTYLTRCSYQTELVPKYGSNTTLNEFVLSEIETACQGDLCTFSGSYQSKNSLMCRVLFSDNSSARNAQIKSKTIESNNLTALVIYVDKYEENVPLAFEYNKQAPPQVEIGCFYDEWTKLEIPAFSYLRDNLPENANLVIRGQGLTYVNYKNITL